MASMLLILILNTDLTRWELRKAELNLIGDLSVPHWKYSFILYKLAN